MEENNNIISSYKVAFAPDKDKLAEYLVKAKGNDRTMQQFAAACGKNPANFSRILNKKITKSLPADLMLKIYENSADSELKLDELMKANGMVSEKAYENRSFEQSAFAKRREERNNRLKKIINILADALYARNQMIRVIDRDNDEMYELRSKYRFKNMGIYADYFIRIANQNPGLWSVTVFGDRIDERDENRFRKCKEKGESIEWFYRTMFVEFLMHYERQFLIDAWAPDLMPSLIEEVKFVFIITDRRVYDALVEGLKGIKVNSYMTFMLLDMENDQFVEETQLERRNGVVNESVMDIKVSENKRNDDEDPDF